MQFKNKMYLLNGASSYYVLLRRLTLINIDRYLFLLVNLFLETQI